MSGSPVIASLPLALLGLGLGANIAANMASLAYPTATANWGALGQTLWPLLPHLPVIAYRMAGRWECTQGLPLS